MKKHFSCLMTALLIIFLMESVLPKAVFAGEPAETASVVMTTGTINLDDSDVLEKGYIDELFGISSSASKGMLKARRITQGSKLTGPNAAAYHLLAGYIADVAAGRRPETEFSLPIESLGIEDKYYLAEDLGVETLFQENGRAVPEAVAKMYELAGFQIGKVMDALAADFPYELYWYDKTTGYSSSYYAYGSYSTGEQFICIPTPFEVSMSVSADYSAGGALRTFLADTEKTGRASAAVDYAQQIVAEYADLEDYEKLDSYRQRICDEVSYNDDIVSQTDLVYGDPWQLVYVFDQDDTTNVVCEGYSKAFQYLCDQSAFKGDVVCNSMSGHMDGGTGAGSHMWNVVTIGGSNYVCDITNVDDNSVGHRGNKLFLAGTSVDADAYGYTFTWESETEGNIIYHGATVFYQYDDETIAQYSEEERVIASENFDPETYMLPDPVDITAEFTDLRTIQVAGLPDDIENPTAYVVAKNEAGEIMSPVAADVVVTDGIIGIGDSAQPDRIYEVKIRSDNYGELRCDVVYTLEYPAGFTVADAIELTADTEAEVVFDQWNDPVHFSFVPDEDAVYLFRSTLPEAGIPFGTVFGTDNQAIAWHDPEIGTEFEIHVHLEAGKTYYLKACIDAEGSAGSCNYQVVVSKKTDETECEHVWGDWEVTQEATCTKDGLETRVCTIDPTHTETNVIKAAGHHFEGPAWIWEENETSGYTADAAFTCTNCGETELIEASVSAVHQDPKPEEDGWIVYTAIVGFEGQEYTDEKPVVIPATGYTYTEEPEWTWASDYSAATATFRCNEDPEKDLIIDADITVEEVPATCTEDGEITYTAEVTYNDNTFTDIKSDLIPAGHSYAEPVWEWEGDYDRGFTVTVTFRCIHGDDTQTKEADIISEEVKNAATCQSTGEIVYTASATGIDGEVLTSIYNVFIPKTDQHVLGEIVGEAAATCTEQGHEAYYECSVCGKLFKDASGTEETTREEIMIPASGHDYEQDWKWKYDSVSGYHADLTLACKNCDEKQQVSSITTDVSEDADQYTCTATGVYNGITYYAEPYIVSKADLAEMNAAEEQIGNVSDLIDNPEQISMDDPLQVDAVVAAYNSYYSLSEEQKERFLRERAVTEETVVKLTTARNKAAAVIQEVKENIQKEINTANSLKASDYTADSYSRLQTVIANASALVGKADVTAEELMNAKADEAIRTAIAGLVKAPNPDPNQGDTPGGTPQTGGNGQTSPAPSVPKVTGGTTYDVAGQAFRVASVAPGSVEGTVTFTQAKNAKAIAVPDTVTLADGKTYRVVEVSPNAFKGNKIRKVTIGANVAKISKNAFAKSKVTTVVLKTQKLTKKTVKGAFKGSKVSKVQVKAGSKKLNKKILKKYKKFFTKKVVGRKVTIK